ncbi:hypothetical protein J2Y69_001402 [Microbacterium resistens]|uniref:DUF4352 domain-containing protein n=1 Tax=Microbacterium resistens TaxID=156977 RepID=A0ABU1SB19_9MICO|nr:hypothetical protein [Microbacterium resistens]MDR6866803.1 hypothetical protein [Microbacterium resistens]
MTARRRMTAVGSWAAALALLVAAGAVSAFTPPENAGEEPFPVSAEVGERGVGRDIDATVDRVVLVHELTQSQHGTTWRGAGTWLLVDLRAAAVVSQNEVGLRGVALEAGGRIYHASNRMTSMYESVLIPGVPRSGSIAIELPDDIPRGPAVLTFSRDNDPRADSQIRVPIDLSTIPEHPSGEISPTEWAR